MRISDWRSDVCSSDLMRELGAEGTRFEFECYDVSHLYNLAHFVDRKVVQPPFFVQGVFGILGGIGADPENVMHMKTTADRLFGEDTLFSALAAGRPQLPLFPLSALIVRKSAVSGKGGSVVVDLG